MWVWHRPGSLAHPVLYGDTITDEVVWDVWVRGPGHPTLHHRCVFPNTGNALPELVRTGLLINSTVDTLGNNAGTVPVSAATALATLPPVLLALFAANAMGSRVPVWASKVRARVAECHVCVRLGGGPGNHLAGAANFPVAFAAVSWHLTCVRLAWCTVVTGRVPA